MLKQESISNTDIEWIYIVAFDEKHRFAMPSKWRNDFLENEKLILLYTGSYGILMKKTTFEENNTEPGIIIHNTRIDRIQRITIPINFIKTYDINPESTIALIGKQNHIEIHFEKEQFMVAKMQALRAAVQFQVNLLTKKH
jgi:DNA-binding transcriptional regulator/RsmH inhibitor MraZ